MPWKSRKLSSSALGMTLFAVVGCYSYYPHGHGGYPGPYTAPPPGAASPGYSAPTTVPPNGTYHEGAFAPNGYPGGSSAQSAPQSGQWQQVPRSEESSPQGNPTDDYESQPNEFQEPQPGGAVPDYEDPNAVDEPVPPAENGETSEDGVSPFSYNDGPSMPQGTTVAAAGSQSPSAVPIPVGAQQEEFQQPVPLQSVSSDEAAGALQPVPGRPNPYDHDREGYRWLRGVVEFDPTDESWHLTYSLKPDSSDRLGGEVTLVDSEKLDVLKNNDVVLVEGSLDADTSDRLGKPRYRVSQLWPLVPKNQE